MKKSSSDARQAILARMGLLLMVFVGLAPVVVFIPGRPEPPNGPLWPFLACTAWGMFFVWSAVMIYVQKVTAQMEQEDPLKSLFAQAIPAHPAPPKPTAPAADPAKIAA